ncbi:hypothetical protein B0F90DRAFT_1758040 [Multifurca ochricompacta]|uniref:Uncharacterized protein n=1 Tax=Multifurca ochricompacta TaxID=376703 RepID=A0AAD4QKJ6_9AGAM|nr:hypothetical protein B0F90DRAFT_1758040 [Multifurca ochricompacta]
MTFVNNGFFSSSDCLILSTSPSSSTQSGMHPDLSAHSWPSDLWSSYYTPNRCTCISKPHDSSTFDPTCIWNFSPAKLAPSTEELEHIYPSPPPTDSDPKHTVPLPVLCEDSSSHVTGGTSVSSLPHPLTLPCSPAPLTQRPEALLTSHPSTQDLPLSPPPSFPMVPHALPEATALCCTHDRTDADADADLDLDMETDPADGDSQSSSSSPDEPPPSDLLTPLFPTWDLPLDDADARPAGTLEVSTLLSRSLVSPLARHGTLGIQAMEGDRITVSSGGSSSSIRDLDCRVESNCPQFRPLLVPPDGLVSARFPMFHTLFPSSNFDASPSDGLLGYSLPSSNGNLFVDSSPLNLLLPDPDSPHVLPKLRLLGPVLQLRRRFPLLPTSLEDPATGHRDGDAYSLITPCHSIGNWPSLSATFDMPQCASFVPTNENSGEEPNPITSFFEELDDMSHDEIPPSPSVCIPSSYATAEFGSGVTLDLGSMDVDDTNFFDYSSHDSDDFKEDVAPSSPMRRMLPELHDEEEDFLGTSPVPSSPSRRTFANLPEDIAMHDPPVSPPQSPLLAGQPLLTLPGAEPDNSLIVSETPVSEWSAPSPPRGSGLGLFLPIQAASSNHAEASETHAIEPNLCFSPEAIARVDALEFEKLKSARRRTWVSERKAKEDEVFHAKRAELLAGRLSMAPPVPSKLADFDERGGVSAGADADGTEGPPGEPAQLDESDEKTIRMWLLYTEARRAEARRVRKREKERGRELHALLRLKLGEDPDVTERAGGAKLKPGKTAIVSMPQLIARMIMKRRDTPRPFSPRKHGSPYIHSVLSRTELEPPATDEYDMDMEG